MYAFMLNIVIICHITGITETYFFVITFRMNGFRKTIPEFLQYTQKHAHLDPKIHSNSSLVHLPRPRIDPRTTGYSIRGLL